MTILLPKPPETGLRLDVIFVIRVRANPKFRWKRAFVLLVVIIFPCVYRDDLILREPVPLVFSQLPGIRVTSVDNACEFAVLQFDLKGSLTQC